MGYLIIFDSFGIIKYIRHHWHDDQHACMHASGELTRNNDITWARARAAPADQSLASEYGSVISDEALLASPDPAADGSADRSADHSGSSDEYTELETTSTSPPGAPREATGNDAGAPAGDTPAVEVAEFESESPQMPNGAASSGSEASVRVTEAPAPTIGEQQLEVHQPEPAVNGQPDYIRTKFKYLEGTYRLLNLATYRVSTLKFKFSWSCLARYSCTTAVQPYVTSSNLLPTKFSTVASYYQFLKV
eukprot:SAG31_NODE_2583_length_5435_cov_55.000000_5_plen_249_part_00